MGEQRKPKKKWPTSIMVKLNKSDRALKNARVVGQVKLRKHKWRGHVQVEIVGVEIDGFGPNDENVVDQKAAG